MAWAVSGTGSVAAANSKTSASTFTTGAVDAAAGEVVILAFSFDNTGFDGPDVSSISVPGGESATWVRLGYHLSGGVLGGAGIRGEVWGIVPNQAWSAFQPVVTFSTNITAKASAGRVFTGGTLTGRGTLPILGGYHASAGTSKTLTGSEQPQNGDLVIGVGTREDNGAPTADSDTTNGTWDSGITSVTSGGTNASNVTLRFQHKIVNATGDQTYNMSSLSADGGAIAVALAPTSSTPVDLGQSTETDLARPFTAQVGSSGTLNSAVSTSLARPFTAQVGVVQAFGQATETDTARPLTAVEGIVRPLNRATETDTARPLTALVGITQGFGQATETDTAQPFTVTLGSGTDLNRATETDLARPLVGALTIPLGRATESDDARGFLRLYLAEAHNRLGGRIRRADALVIWDPPVEAAPTSVVPVDYGYDVAIAHSNLTVVGGVVDYDMTSAEKPKHRDRIIVGGKDVTYFRGVETPTPSFMLVKPLLYGSGKLEFPQIHAPFETPGVGELSWLRAQRRVKVQRVDVDTGEVVKEDYCGHIAGFNARGRSLVCNLGGEVAGKAAMRIIPVPVFKRTRKWGRLVYDAMRVLVGDRFTPRLGPNVGIELNTFGGMSHLDYLLALTARSTKLDGTHRTITKDDDGTWSAPVVDRETVNATVYFDDARMVPDLQRDISEEPNRIYATGVAKDGRKITFRIYPGLKQGSPPEYPFNDNSAFGEGTLDVDTDTGDGITTMNHRLILMGYLDREDNADKGVYDDAVTRAVKRLQDEAGITETGIMNPATWRALYDLDKTSYSLNGARQMPAAQRSKTRMFNYTASGAVAGKNPNYDPHELKRDIELAMGPGMERQQIKDFAVMVRDQHAVEKSWVGTVTAHLGVIAGEHVPGTPIVAADVIPARDVRPGWNLWAPYWDGGTLFHVVGVNVPEGGGAPTFALDTKARDTMQAWEVIARNRESRISPERAWLNQYRSSQVAKDGITTWDSIGGTVDDRVFLPGDRWTVIQTVGGQAGTIQSIRTELDNAQCEYVIAVFGRSISEARLNHAVPDPLSADGTQWWQNEAVLNRLDRRVLLYASGTDEQPLGYWPGQKTNDVGEATGDPITGKHRDDASVPYRTFAEPVLHVAIYAAQDAWLQPGRIMWQQLEEGS